jgi:predicted nucleic acid-binding protein
MESPSSATARRDPGPNALRRTGVLTVDANVWIAALDASDPFHRASIRFLETVRDQGHELRAPAILLVEAACAVARRRNDEGAGLAAAATLRNTTALRIEPHDSELENGALELGTRLLVRGADTYYIAVAARSRTPLITWDGELVERAGGQTPAQWLSEAS